MPNTATKALINDHSAHNRSIVVSTPSLGSTNLSNIIKNSLPKNVFDVSKYKLKFSSDFLIDSTIRNSFPKSYIINESFDAFVNSLDLQDKYAINSSIEEIKSFQFVESVDFESNHTPTLIINLPEVNRDHEKKIYKIEYNLLRKTKVNIDFEINFP